MIEGTVKYILKKLLFKKSAVKWIANTYRHLQMQI